jgi:anti-sigma B factor antagonist
VTQELLRTAIAQSDGTARVAVDGEVDLSSVGVLRDALREAVGLGVPEVVVDGSKLEYLDSSGLNCLVTARAEAEATGTHLVVRNVNEIIRRILDVSGLTELLCDDPAGS